MRSDAELQKDIIDELRWEPRVSEREIGVAVKGGVVSLTGAVPSYAEKYLAEMVVEGFAGVRAIANDLVVKLPSASVRTDTEIAHQVVNALQWDVKVPETKVKARVVDGWVTLEGEVAFLFQKDAAYHAVRNLTGVRGVTNVIKVLPVTSPRDVSQSIKDALRRRADQDAAKIMVTTKDHVVTLSGSVSSFAERRAAESAAWSAPGVTEVRDHLVVSV